jgi:hypothetical protein
MCCTNRECLNFHRECFILLLCYMVHSGRITDRAWLFHRRPASLHCHWRIQKNNLKILGLKTCVLLPSMFSTSPPGPPGPPGLYPSCPWGLPHPWSLVSTAETQRQPFVMYNPNVLDSETWYYAMKNEKTWDQTTSSLKIEHNKILGHWDTKQLCIKRL